MPKTTLKDLQDKIDAKEILLKAYVKELDRYQKIFQSLKILIDLQAGDNNAN